MKDGTSDAVAALAAVELSQRGPALGFVVDIGQSMQRFIDATKLCDGLRDWRAIDPRHTEMASFRAIEQGFNLARQTSQGLSAAYDYEGHQLAQMDQYQAQELTMVAQLPIRGVRTLYSLLGNWLAWLCLVGLIALIWLGIRSPVNSRQ